VVIRLALVLSMCVIAGAQTLRIAPVTAARGSTDIFRIVLKPRAERPIAALQWDLVYRDAVRIESSGVVAGTAPEAAGKTVACVSKPPAGGNHRLRCILAGGVQALAAGPIAIVRFEIPTNIPRGETPVLLERVMGVSTSLSSVPMEGTRASIAIR
jgi:hypothetical protein